MTLMESATHRTLVPRTRHGKFRDNAGSQLVASPQWLIVHLCGGQGVGEMVLLEAGGRRMKKGVDVSNGLVWAVPVLQINRRRMGNGRMHAARGPMVSNRRAVVVVERVDQRRRPIRRRRRQGVLGRQPLRRGAVCCGRECGRGGHRQRLKGRMWPTRREYRMWRGIVCRRRREDSRHGSNARDQRR